MHPAARTTLSFAVFFGAVVIMTFAATFTHELSHALAWGDVPDVTFADGREEATGAITHEERMFIPGQSPGHPGRHYHVSVVDQTTIALYPKSILAAGASLGLAPSWMLPDPVMGSTFYALDDADYAKLAAGETVTQWHHSAMPMIVNAAFAVPIMLWLWLRPGPLSMAAAWVNASEWRFNVHHAEEVGIPAGLYMALALVAMSIIASLIGYLGVRRRDLNAPGTPTATA